MPKRLELQIDRKTGRTVSTAFSVILVLWLSAFAAFKHTHLLRSEPRADTTVTTPPAAIRLWFSEPIQLAVSSVRLTDAAGHAITTGRLAAAASANAPVVADVKAQLPAGRFTVAWRVLARDGHVANGHFSFTVAAPASH